MPEIVVRLAAVARRELVRETLGAHAVYGRDVVVVRNRRVSAFHGPHRLGESANRGGRVKDDLRSVQPERLPVQRVVPAVADVDRDLAKRRLKHGMPGVALHVIGRLVEVADSRDVVFAVNKTRRQSNCPCVMIIKMKLTGVSRGTGRCC